MATIGTNLGLTYAWNLGENNWKTGMDANLKNLDTLVQANVKGFQTAPPGSPVAGDTYLTGNGCTGAWSGNDQKVARWSGAAWEFITPKTGWTARRNTDAKIFTKEASGWQSSAFADYTYGDVAVVIAGSYQFSSSGDSALLFSAPGGASADFKMVDTGRFRWHTDLYLSRPSANTLRISSDGSTGAANLDVRGAIQIGGTQVISSGRAATFASATISNLTSGRVTFAAAAGALTDAAGLVVDSASNVLFVGVGASSSFVAIDGTSGNSSGISLRTAASARWSIRRGATAEGSSDTGSQFEIVARNDSGAEIDSPLSIARVAAGTITWGGSTNRPIRSNGVLAINAAPRPTTEWLYVYGADSTMLGATVEYAAGAVGQPLITANATGNADATQVLFRGRALAANKFLVYANGDVDIVGAYKVGNTTVISAARAATFAGLTLSSGTASLAASTTGGPSLSIPAGTAPSAPAAGNVWHDSTRKALLTYSNAALGVIDRTIYSQHAAVTQAGVVTNQSLASGSSIGSRTLPANFLNVTGKRLKYYLCGYYSTDAVPGTAEIRIRLGSTTFRTTGTFNLDANITNGWWRLMGEITCFTTGVTGTVQGMMTWEHQSSNVAGSEVVHLQVANSVAAVTVDLTASQAFDVEWTASDSGTSLSCTCYSLQELA